MAHNFAQSLKAGKAGELLFQALAAAAGIELTQTDGRKGDFEDTTGAVWEVKTDFYDMNKTSNFFIERYSNAAKATNGGPYQAMDHSCTYFVYFFPINKVAFIFKTADLLEQLLIVPMGEPIYIKNGRYETIGFKVSRASLTPFRVIGHE